MNTASSVLLILSLLLLAPGSLSAANAAEGWDISPTRPDISPKTREAFQKLIPTCDKKIQSDPRNPDAYLARAKVWLFLKNYSLAIADAKDAVRLNSQSAEAHGWLAYALMMTGDHASAVPEFSKSVELGADKSTTCKSLALCRVKLRDYEGALRDLDEAIQAPNDSKPHVALLYQIRGFVRLLSGDPNGATADLDEAVRLFPQAPGVYQARGKLWLLQGQCGKAISDFEQALRRDKPDNPRYRTLVSLLDDLDFPSGDTKPNHAQEICDKTDWKNWLALAIYADGLFQAGRYDDGMKWLSTSIELAPDDMKEQLRNRREDHRRRSPFQPAVPP